MRYVVLFLIRLVGLLLSWLLFFHLFNPVHLLLKGKLQRPAGNVRVLRASASWTGMIKYYRPGPAPVASQDRCLWPIIPS